MNIKKVLVGLTLITVSLGFISCSDDPEDEPTTSTTATTGTPTTADGITFSQTGTLKLDITHKFGSVPFGLSPASFVTAAQDTIVVSQFAYYVSNVVLTSVNGTQVPLEGYFLEEFLPGQPNTITLQNVPAGNYKTISYMIGVDSLANSTGSHTGDLDPSYGMYWTWNTGYVFVRLKGRHSSANSPFSFDIGGTPNAMLFSHNLLSYKVKGTTITSSLMFDMEKVFNAPYVYDLKSDPNDIHSTTSAGIEKFKANIENAVSLTAIH